MDAYKIIVEYGAIGLVAGAGGCLLGLGIKKIRAHFREAAERAAAHRKGEIYWRDVNWAERARAAGTVLRNELTQQNFWVNRVKKHLLPPKKRDGSQPR